MNYSFALAVLSAGVAAWCAMFRKRWATAAWTMYAVIFALLAMQKMLDIELVRLAQLISSVK
jgi:hypothetical protein